MAPFAVMEMIHSESLVRQELAFALAAHGLEVNLQAGRFCSLKAREEQVSLRCTCPDCSGLHLAQVSRPQILHQSPVLPEVPCSSEASRCTLYPLVLDAACVPVPPPSAAARILHVACSLLAFSYALPRSAVSPAQAQCLVAWEVHTGRMIGLLSCHTQIQECWWHFCCSYPGGSQMAAVVLAAQRCSQQHIPAVSPDHSQQRA